MADYSFPKYVEERVRYFDGQFLQDQDFIDEQKYHIDRLRRHNRYLHATGVIEGLTVDAGTKLVTVANGTALDPNGHLIVLSKDNPAEVSTAAFTGRMILVIQFKEDETRPTAEGSAGNSRFQTNPTLSLVAADNIPADAVVLAGLNIGAGGDIDADQVDTSVRIYSGLNLPGRADGAGPTLRGLSLNMAQLDGALTVAEDVRINDNELFFRAGIDKNHGLGWYGGNKKFDNVGLDGPVLYGYSGGMLGTTNGGQKKVLTWKNSGNVGIGTDSPGQALSAIGVVRGANAVDESEYTEIGHGGSHGYINTRGDGNLDFRHDSATKMSLTDNGDLGIGTTAPDSRLEVTGGDVIINNGGSGRISYKNAATLLSQIGVSDGSKLFVANKQAGNIGFETNGIERVTVDKDGNVGIGATEPGKKLHVEAGELRVRSSSNGKTADIGAFFANNLTQGIGIGYNRIEAVGSNTNQDIFLAPKGTGDVAVEDGNFVVTGRDDTSLWINAKGGVKQQKAFIDFRTTFNHATDHGPRWTGTVEAGYGSGGWGTEYLSFRVGGSNDSGKMPDEKFRIQANGNVGIGTTDPVSKLEVRATGDGARVLQLTTDRAWAFEQEGGGSGASLRLRNINGANKNFYIDTDGSSMWRNVDGTTVLMKIDHGSGKVGIGTGSPRARLHITGSGDTIAGFTGASSGGAWMSNGSGAGSDEIGWAWDAARDGDANRNLTDVSIYADGSIVADGTGVFVATTVKWSDARSKNIIGISDGKKDLENLLRIRVTDYVKIREGNREKKVVAQELSQVFPQAVSMMQGVVPTIFQAPDDFSYNVDKKELTIKLGKAHGLIGGDEIDVYTDKERLQKIEVLRVLSEHTFVVACDYEPAKVFVYGKWVDDVHMVDYDAIAMLNVSATQQLYRLTQSQKKVIGKISKQNMALKKAVAELQEKMKNRKTGVLH